MTKTKPLAQNLQSELFSDRIFRTTRATIRRTLAMVALISAQMPLALSSSPAIAAPACRDVFLSIRNDAKLEWFKDLTVTEKLLHPWTLEAGKIHSSEAFEGFVEKIADSLKQLSSADKAHLQNLDVLAIYRSLPEQEQNLLKPLLLKNARRVVAGQGRATDLWLFPLAVHLDPTLMTEFIKRIETFSEKKITLQQLLMGRAGLAIFNRSMVSVLADLPRQTKNQAIEDLRNRFQAIDLKQEITIQVDGKFRAPTSRYHRRNLEAALFLMLRPELNSLFYDLQTVKSEAEAVLAIDRYFAELDQVTLPKRGGYSFAKALTAARTVQKNFAQHLDNSDRYVEIYGSLPNGKATAKTSDVDIKISMSLLEELTGQTEKQIAMQPASPIFADAIKRYGNQLPAKGQAFWRDYQSAESDLALNVFQRSVSAPSDVLTSFFPPIAPTYDAYDMRWYNPITIRVYHDTIKIMVYDLSSPNRKYIQLKVGG